MTPEQIENCKKLIAYLKSGKLKANFDMRGFSSFKPEIESKKTNCGTVGCALGHGPYAGVPKKITESWVDYSANAFGISQISLDNKWSFIFSSAWKGFDDTPEGAANRLQIVLDDKYVNNWSYNDYKK